MDFLPFCISKDAADLHADFTIINEPYGDGLSFEACGDTDDCRGSRECKSSADVTLPCTEQPCLCQPSELRKCRGNGDCGDGEVCGEFPDTTEGRFAEPSCMSPRYIEKSGGIAVLLKEKGFTFDECDEADECEPPRACLYGDDTPCVERKSCRCRPGTLVNCSSTAECSLGETCAQRKGEQAVCVSEKFVAKSAEWQPLGDEEPSSTDQPETSREPETATILRPGHLCIGIQSLAHFERHELVFERDSYAEVFCDREGSCATAGHMVLWMERAMMMRRYCEAVGCRRDIMRVNSPRYVRGRLVKSFTDGLMFTTFAARYETVVEEIVLGGIIRFDRGCAARGV